MDSVRAQRRRRPWTAGATTTRALTAMLLVALALPLGTAGAYGEEPAAEETSPSTAQAQQSGESGPAQQQAEGSIGETDGVAAAEQAEEPGVDPAEETATDPAEEPATDPAEEADEQLAAEESSVTTTEERSVAAAAAPAPLALVAPVSVTGGFEIDGDTAANNDGLDWDTTGTKVVDGAGDSTVYSSGDELGDPRTWADASNATAPGNDDIVEAYSHTAMVDGRLWVYFAFSRDATSGTSNYVVEYNRLPNHADVPAQPRRSPGDLRIRVVQGGNGTFSVAGVERWSLAGGSGCTAVSSIDGGTLGHWCAAPDATTYFIGVSSGDKVFAEGALDLSGALDGAGDCLGGYGVVNMRSFSGGSQRSSLKDYVSAASVDVPSTCGSLDVLKVDQFGDPVPGATFTVAPDPTPGGGAGPLQVTDGGAGDPDGTADGTISLDPARPGSYTVTETGVPPGHLPPTDPTQTVEVPRNGSDSVTFVNAKAFGSLTVTTTAAATYDVRHTWRVDKIADRTAVDTPEGTPADVGYTVLLEADSADRSGHEAGGTATIVNPNDTAVTATVTAELAGATCTVAGADASPAPGHQVTLQPGEQDVTYTCPVGAAAQDPGSATVTVAWDGATYPPVPGTDPANPATATDDVAWAVDERLDEQVVVTDAFDGGAAEELGTYGWADVHGATLPADRAPGGVALTDTVVVDTYRRSIPGVPGACTPYDNTATATGADTGAEDSAGTTVEVCVGRDLDVDKTVGVSWTRAYGWDLAKTGPATVFVGDDGAATATYDITATATQPTDSEVTVGGTITVSNPNDWNVPAVVTDRFVLRGTAYPCTVVDGDPVVVPADDEVVLDYTCDLGALPGDVWPDGYDGANEVTVTWDAEEYFTPAGDVVFTHHVEGPEQQETPVHATVTLADELTGADGSAVPVDLGSAGELTWADVHAATDHRVTVPVTVDLAPELAAGECTTLTNTVSIPGTSVADSATTEVCRPAVDTTVDARRGRAQLWSLDKTVDREAAEVAAGGSASFTWTVTATPTEVVDHGVPTWDGTVSVTNPSAAADLTVDVTDVVGVPGWTCTFVDSGEATATGVVVGPSETTELAYTCTGSGHASGDNAVHVDFGEERVTDVEPVTFEEQEVTDATVDVVDDRAGDGAEVLFTADAADESTWSHTYEQERSGDPGECTSWTNRAWVDLAGDREDPRADATVRVCVEASLEVSTTASGSYDRDYDWELTKESTAPTASIAEGGSHRFPYRVTATPAGWTDSDFEASGTVTVTNPNGYAAGSITARVSAELSGISGAGCTVDDPDVQLAPGQQATLDYECDLKPTAGDYVGESTATATWTPAPLHVPTGGQDPTEASTTSPATGVSLALDGTTDFDVEVTDDPQGPSGPDLLGTATWGDHAGTATAGEPTVFTYDGPERQGVAGECTPYTNTARLDQAVGEDREATAEVELCVEAAPDLSVAAAASHVRDHAWTIDKVAHRTEVQAVGTEPAQVRWTVRAVPGATTDSGWELTGTTTVANPNTWTDLAVDLALTTDVGEDVTCEHDAGPLVTLAPGQSATVPFTCGLGGTSYDDGTLTATATWGEDRTGTATTPAVWDVTRHHDVVTVRDDLGDPEGPGRVLGTAEWNAGGEATELTYTLPLDARAGFCEDVTNTAEIVETAQQAQATVEVCREQVRGEEPGPTPTPGPSPTPGPAPDADASPAADVEVKSAEESLPQTGAPAGLVQLGALAALSTLVGLVLLWSSRRVRRRTG